MRTKLYVMDPFRPTDLLERRPPRPAPHKHETETVIIAKLPHGFCNRLLLMRQSESSRIMHYQGPILKRTGHDLFSVSPVLSHENLVLRNTPLNQARLHLIAQSDNSVGIPTRDVRLGPKHSRYDGLL